MAAASKASKTDESVSKKTSSSIHTRTSTRYRTIKPPARPGTIKRSVIRKAIKEIMAEQTGL
jgi:hypothetical protein